MFFIGGVGQKQEYLKFFQLVECKCCHQLSSIKIIMVYSYFSFFFIPLFKWNKQYFVECENCKSYAPLDKEIGREIEKGIRTTIDANMLYFQKQNRIKQCSNCGYMTQENFDYCPKCGNKL